MAEEKEKGKIHQTPSPEIQPGSRALWVDKLTYDNREPCRRGRVVGLGLRAFSPCPVSTPTGKTCPSLEYEILEP